MRFLQPNLHPQSWTSRRSPLNWCAPPLDYGSTLLHRNETQNRTPPEQSRYQQRLADPNHTRSVRITWQGAAL